MTPSDVSPLLAGGPRNDAPMALWEVHRSLAIGDRIAADESAVRSWPSDLLAAVIEGAGFSAVERRRRVWQRERTLADTTAGDLRVLLVGLNPSLHSADVGFGFAGPGNRFWPAALAAGLVTADRDPLEAITVDRVGMTDLVKRATPRADALTSAEYVHGIGRLRVLVEWLRPGVVCIIGLSGWRVAVDRKAVAGLQEQPFGGRPVYVMPNPSGVNAHATPEVLADHFRAVLTLAPR